MNRESGANGKEGLAAYRIMNALVPIFEEAFKQLIINKNDYEAIKITNASNHKRICCRTKRKK
jgi:hypothetical protein